MDEATWNEIFRAEMPALYRAISRRVGGERQLAEDATQEAWLRALEAWTLHGVPGNPGAWLRTAAMNLLRNYFSRRAAEATGPLPALGEAEIAETLRVVPAVDLPDRAEVLQKCLARLPPAQSELLQERYFDGATVADLALALGTTQRGIEGRLRRARAALARELGVCATGRGADS